MKRIKSKNIKKLDFELFYDKCLIYYDGPILIKYNDKDAKIYLSLWSDYNYKLNRWVYFHITNEDYILYENKTKDLYDLIKFSDDLYIIDIDVTGNFKRVYSIKIDELPIDYIPDKK